MWRARRVALAREALPAVTAWVDLVLGGDDRAHRMASDAIVTAASAPGVATVSDVTHAARDDIARRLAGGEAAVPAPPATQQDQPPSRADAPSPAAAQQPPLPPVRADASSPYLPAYVGPVPAPRRASDDSGAARPPGEVVDEEPELRTPAARLADGLAALRPHERLAAVRFYLDDVSTDSIASLLGIDRHDAVALLESVTAVLAPIVGESDLPDFAAVVDQVEVVTR